MLHKIINTIGTRGISALLTFLITVIISQALGAAGKGEQAILLTTIAFVLIFSDIVSGKTLVYLTPIHAFSALFLPSYLWSLLVGMFAWGILLFLPLEIDRNLLVHVSILAVIASWNGVNIAILMGKEVINSPFAVINADDFYGKESYEVLAEFLQSVENQQNKYCMVGYRIDNTLSESGTVNRGVCVVGSDGNLQNIVERTKIESKGGAIVYSDENGLEVILAPQTPVSMNMWGFTPDYFDYSTEFFKDFLQKEGDNLKSEFYIPTAVNKLITEKTVTCRVLDTSAKWCGVTYPDDRPQVVLKINELIKRGIYPEKLFK